MSFKVLHRGYQHIRLSSSFSLTLDIQDYLRSLARDEKGVGLSLSSFTWINSTLLYV